MSIKSIFSSVLNFVKSLLPWEKKLVSGSIAIGNDIKDIINSPIADVIVNLTSTNLDNVALTTLRSWLAIFFKETKLIQDTTGDFETIVAQVSETVNSMTLPEAKAVTMNGIVSAINTKVAELSGKSFPIEKSMAVVPVVYAHPELVA